VHCAKAQKLDGATLPAEVTRPMPTRNEDHEREEYEESIEALKKLFEGRNAAPSGAVQTLLDKTQAHRKTWLQTVVSIHDIISTYISGPKGPKMGMLISLTYKHCMKVVD